MSEDTLNALTELAAKLQTFTDCLRAGHPELAKPATALITAAIELQDTLACEQITR